MQSALVPPGPETGLFYIPICNLPFDTTWKTLKEWVCRDCEVDYVQVFSTSTSGWIRVRGPYNFYRACDRLKEGVFNGRRIMYDDRNMTSPVMVKEVVDFNASPVSAPSGPPQPGFSMSQQNTGPYSYATSSETIYDQWNPNTSSTAQGDYSDLQQTTWYPDSGPSSGSPPSINDQVVATEHRRIIVRRIGHNASDDQVKALIKQSLEGVTPVKAELQRIDVPRGSNNQTRGHAFATFRTPDTARGVAEALNGMTWNSRRLEARLTSEGITEEQASRPSQSSTSRPRKGNDASKKKKRPDEKTRVSPTSGSGSRPSSEPSSSHQAQIQQPQTPIIADGTSGKTRSESKDKKKK